MTRLIGIILAFLFIFALFGIGYAIIAIIAYLFGRYIDPYVRNFPKLL